MQIWGMTLSQTFYGLLLSYLTITDVTSSSGAPAARRAAKRSPILIMQGKDKRNPWVDFLMVILASGIARGCVRTTTTTSTTAELPNMAVILQKKTYSLSLPCTSLKLDIPAMINWHLSKQAIRWPVPRDHIAGSSLQLIEITCFYEVDRWPSVDFSIGSRAHVRLTCW